MLLPRIIPVLLVKGEGLYKTVKFKNPVYIGDPVNAIRIFNEKEVDELIVLDIETSVKGMPINYNLIERIASEAFMPVGYGGGIKSFEEAKKIFALGIEKVVINTSALTRPELITEISETFGNQSVVVAIDIKKNIFGKNEIYAKSGSQFKNIKLNEYLTSIVKYGCGEIFINSIDRDGMMNGYDISLLKTVTNEVNVPVIACGGAGAIEHLADVIVNANVSAAAAGSMFVFHGKHKAVLITYPTTFNIQKLINKGNG